jgi:hypothetical protein
MAVTLAGERERREFRHRRACGEPGKQLVVNNDRREFQGRFVHRHQSWKLSTSSADDEVKTNCGLQSRASGMQRDRPRLIAVTGATAKMVVVPVFRAG